MTGRLLKRLTSFLACVLFFGFSLFDQDTVALTWQALGSQDNCIPNAYGCTHNIGTACGVLNKACLAPGVGSCEEIMCLY